MCTTYNKLNKFACYKHHIFYFLWDKHIYVRTDRIFNSIDCAHHASAGMIGTNNHVRRWCSSCIVSSAEDSIVDPSFSWVPWGHKWTTRCFLLHGSLSAPLWTHLRNHYCHLCGKFRHHLISGWIERHCQLVIKKIMARKSCSKVKQNCFWIQLLEPILFPLDAWIGSSPVGIAHSPVCWFWTDRGGQKNVTICRLLHSKGHNYAEFTWPPLLYTQKLREWFGPSFISQRRYWRSDPLDINKILHRCSGPSNYHELVPVVWSQTGQVQ